MGWIFRCFKSAIVANGLDSPRNRVATMTERPFDSFGFYGLRSFAAARENLSQLKTVA